MAQQRTSAEIRGLVTTRNEVPLIGAEVTVLRDSLSAVTDSSGSFVLRGIPPGEYVIRVRRIGYRPQYFAASLARGERKEVTVALDPGAFELPEVEVTARLAKPIEYAWTTKYDDFFRRKRVGLGYYISRKDIDRKAAAQTASLLLGVPGIKLHFGASGVAPNTIECVRARKPGVWVDGTKQRWDDLFIGSPVGEIKSRPGELLDRVLPLQIEMIEIYTSPARMPAEFLGDADCAVVIWTR